MLRMLLGIQKSKVRITQIVGRRSEMGHLSTHEIDHVLGADAPKT